MASKRKEPAGTARSVSEIQQRLDAQVQQLEAALSAGEKKVKNMGLAVSNSIFKKAQEAFERCEGINGESDDMRERSAADHARHKKELAAKRQALARRVAAAAAGTAELRAVQKEAVQVIAELRSKMIAAPGSGAGELEASGAGAKRRKAVAFQQPRRGGVA